MTLRVLDKAQHSVRATSYIDPKQWWGSEIARAYDEQLKTTKQHVTLFQRIFIVGSTEEARSLRSVMDAQEKAGLQVKYICATSIPADQRSDFIIVDSAVAAELTLNEQRQFKSAHFFSTRVRADDFDRRFNNLWIAGSPPSDIGRVTCAPSSGK